jgi:SOUL heme-binding protein
MNTQEALYFSPAAPTLVRESDSARFEPDTARTLGRATLVAPLAGAIGGALLLASDRHASRRFGLLALGAAAGLIVARWQWARALNWQPPYRVELENGRLEIRRYGQEIHAETTIEGATWERALEEGFQTLAGYIFGHNGSGVKLPMTSPVMTTLNDPSAKRGRAKAWKAPTVGSIDDLTGPGTRTMAFVMPGNLTLDDLPAPQDDRVQLRVVPPRRVAALTFRGRYAGELPAQKRNELLFLAKCAGLSVKSEVVFAGYDAPSTLPLLRRNEVLVEIDG